MADRCAHILKVASVWLVIAALLASAQAHRSAAHTFDPALQAFIAAGGSLEDLCDADHLPHDALAETCFLCLPSAGLLWTGQDNVLRDDRHPVALVYGPANRSHHARDPGFQLPHARAPPA
ncbi:MAG: hypothetical protein AB8B58_19115 [Roseobacter sp.]